MKNSNASFDLLNWIKRKYLSIAIIFLTLYLLLAFLAPILMHTGNPLIAKVIYRGYSNLCHQYAYRSFFLFGSQAHYPLESHEGQLSVFDVFNIPRENPEISRKIIGNAETGYKVAICQRDVALYGALLAFAIIFFFGRNQIKKIPAYIWILFAVIPIGIDGMWQLAGSLGFLSLSYESTPMVRTITGVLFGFFSGWLLFPSIEQSIQKDGSLK